MRDTLNCARVTLRRAGLERNPKTWKWANSRKTQHFSAPLRKCASGLSLCCAREEERTRNPVWFEHFPYSPKAGTKGAMNRLRAMCAGKNRPRRGDPSRRSPPITWEKLQSRQEEEAEAQQKLRSPKRAGRWVCLTQQPPPVTGCVKVELHSVCAPRLLQGRGHTYPHTAPLAPWVARSSVGSLVARRLPGRHSSVAASRCAAGLDFLRGAVPREGRHLGVLKVVFCPQAHAGHVS